MSAGILEASMSTLQEGQLLLDRIREMGVHADVQNRHATTAACYGIEHLLELLQDRRRHLEELWLQRKVRLEQCLQLLLLDQEVNKVSKRLLDVLRGFFRLVLGRQLLDTFELIFLEEHNFSERSSWTGRTVCGSKSHESL